MPAPQPRSSSVFPLLSGLVAVAVLAIAGLWLARFFAPGPATPPPQPAAKTPVDDPQHAPVAPAAGEQTPLTQDPRDRVLPIMYPDGTSQPPLNGVKVPPAIYWPPQVPYSPVDSKIVDDRGMEWYHHKDGSTSTVFMTWRPELGRYDATSQVRVPTAPQTVVDENNRQVPGPGQPGASGGTPPPPRRN